MEEHEYRAMFDVEKSHWWFISRRTFVRTLLRASGFPDTRRKSSRVLKIADIGAGTGGMIPFLRQYGTVIGVEPSIWGRRLAKKRGIVLRMGKAERTGIRAKSVDVVCFFDVLYHRGLRDTRALTEAKRILRPGGWLIITDCALPFLTGPHDQAVEGRERYTLPALGKKVISAGFQIETKTYMYFLLFPMILVKRMIDRFVVQTNGHHSDMMPVHPWVNTFCTVLNAIETRGLQFVRYPWGSSLFILARKEEV